MKRSGWAAFTLLPLAIALMGLTCHERSDDVTTPVRTPPTQPAPTTKKPPEGLVDLKGRLWLAPAVIGTPKLPCTETTDEASGPGVGGFVCSTVHHIWLNVSSGVTVDRPYVKVQSGDCIYWETRAADNTPALIRGIDFIDPTEQVPPNKVASSHTVGRVFCTNGTPGCVRQIGLPDGKYTYEVTVRHNGVDKKADPEIEVSCPTCDPPPQSGS